MTDQVAELYRAGCGLLDTADWARALEAFDAALAILPPNDPDGPGELFNFRGQALARLGRSAEALVAHEAALAAGPRCPQFLADLGETHAALGHRQQAVVAYEEALSISLPGEEILDRIYEALNALS